MHACMYICMLVYMYVCRLICGYTHIHTETHTRTRTLLPCVYCNLLNNDIILNKFVSGQQNSHTHCWTRPVYETSTLIHRFNQRTDYSYIMMLSDKAFETQLLPRNYVELHY